MTRAAASSCDALVPRARTGSDPADLAVVTVRTRLAAFLDELATVPGSPQLAVLRDRAEALDRAVALRDRGEIDARWVRLHDALALFCPPGSAGHEIDLAALAPTLAALR